MNISGIRTYASFYDYNEIKNGEVRSQQIQQQNPEEEVQEAQNVTSVPDTRELDQSFGAFDYAKQYQPDKTYELKGTNSDLDLLDVNQVLSDVQKDQVLQQYQFFVGESKAQTNGSADLVPPAINDFSL